MSYRKTFDRTVRADYKGHIYVNYRPGDQNHSPEILVEYNGEHTRETFSGTGNFYIYDYAEEDVEVQIDVDTTPFDVSVANCNNHVNGLTASVGAMNTAQCIAIAENADKVSKSIIDGFFHSVRTDLSTQKAELEQIIEAKLLLLRQQALSLKEKQQTMADDYARTTARYQKIFSDLNNELSVRIHEIDQPVFNLVKEVDIQSDRMLHTDMVQTAVTMSKESSILQAQISAATVKNHALEAMEMAQNFLTSKAVSERTIHDTTIEGSGEDKYLIPVCFMRTASDKDIVQKCIVPEYYSKNNESLQNRLCDTLEEYEFPIQTESEIEQLQSYVQTEMANKISGADNHSARVRDMINKMLNK